ncbi:hypothetical protein T440DRAFT_71705 [Plenodomus tracheiphilus IPT5]|uniref:Uncharacterized protein n=1 Tax=Plenodomus tracheiphilus IPT5 TaxID=1408161 RepID=A0A6A7B700_9PLEO|nr:hypothetical protein T440DRAFT_71705 [Plenodomus tracheiphilus IPT5]
MQITSALDLAQSTKTEDCIHSTYCFNKQQTEGFRRNTWKTHCRRTLLDLQKRCPYRSHQGAVRRSSSGRPAFSFPRALVSRPTVFSRQSASRCCPRHTATLQFSDPCSPTPSPSPLPLCAPHSLPLAPSTSQKYVTHLTLRRVPCLSLLHRQPPHNSALEPDSRPPAPCPRPPCTEFCGFD